MTDVLLVARDVAIILGCEPRGVTEGYATVPGFPKPLRLTGPEGRRSHPRWWRSELIDWIESHRNGATKRGGRPRNKE